MATPENTKDLLIPPNPGKLWKKTAKNSQNTKEVPFFEKTKEKQNTKEKKIRAVPFPILPDREETTSRELKLHPPQLNPDLLFLAGLDKSKAKPRKKQSSSKVAPKHYVESQEHIFGVRVLHKFGADSFCVFWGFQSSREADYSNRFVLQFLC